MSKPKHLDLFSGIGGFALAAKWAGYKTVQFVEIDSFCQKVLNKNFPNIPIHSDIKDFSGTKYYGTIDLLSGGFPCQPFSVAGKRRGDEDERALWYEMFRTIREVKPTWVIAENVRGLLSIEGGMVFEQVCLDLESVGYEVQPIIIPACSVNAPHKRDRVWIVAHSNSMGWKKEKRKRIQPKIKVADRQKSYNTDRKRITADSNVKRLEGQNRGKESYNTAGSYRGENKEWEKDWREVAAEFCRVDDGLPRRMDRTNRLKSLGNAIVPQVAYQIIKAIYEQQ